MSIYGKTKTTREAPLSLIEDQGQTPAATTLSLAQIQQQRKRTVSYIREISNSKGWPLPSSMDEDTQWQNNKKPIRRWSQRKATRYEEPQMTLQSTYQENYSLKDSLMCFWRACLLLQPTQPKSLTPRWTSTGSRDTCILKPGNLCTDSLNTWYRHFDKDSARESCQILTNLLLCHCKCYSDYLHSKKWTLNLSIKVK